MNFGYSAITIDELRAPTRHHGFSMIELLIAVVIVAILSAIAFPSYQSYLRRGSRAAAQALLMDVANRQAQYMLDARNYAVGPGALAALNITTLPTDVNGYYAVAVENAAGGATPTIPPTFLIKATPVAGTRQEVDGELKLGHDGGKWRGGNPGW
jgi:type IV pilus assembly protein PilE